MKLSSTVSSFTNSGEMLFGSFTQNGDNYTFASEKATDRIAVEKTGTTTINFTNSGKINGVVRLTAANGTQGNIVTLTAGSQGNEFITGSGNDTFNVTGIIGSDTDNALKQFNSLDGGSGSDTLNLASSNYTVNKADTIKNIEQINLNSSSKLTLNDVLPNGTDTFVISSNSIMQYNTKTDKEFAQQVQGTGLFTVKGDPSKNDLTFDFKNKQNNFNGTPTAGEGATCRSCAHCPWMAMNGLKAIAEGLEQGGAEHEIHVDEALRTGALIPLNRMLDFAATLRG